MTLSSTLLGFAFGTALGILIAVGIVHVATLDRSLMPWIIASQTIPILAIAPMIIVVLAAVGITGLIPKALISTYLSFFPVAVGMVKGLRSPEIINLDLMHTYYASKSQTFWKLRVPASVPFLFTSMKVAIAASLVGAIVGELPTGAVAGIGAKLLSGLLLQRHDRHVVGIGRRLGFGSPARGDRRYRRPRGRALDGGSAGMSGIKLPWQAALAVILALAAALGLPLLKPDVAAFTPMETALIFALVLAAAAASVSPISRALCAAILLVDAHAAAAILLLGVARSAGAARFSFFLLLAAAWLLAWLCVALLSEMRPANRQASTFLRLLIPFIFGVWILIIWEGITRGAGVPFILLPPPSLIGVRIANSLPILAADVNQTVFKSVVIGYALGCSLGFLAAILADRVPFFRRGLLPIGNMVSALPIIGVAPIMVMWFGFDWHSKAAVVVIMTFFPMLVNTVAGLAASGHMERDLMRTYASDYWQTLRKLRLPAAAPFIFNALKINSTLAMIGAIVAEFFGTPIVGMGFRISTEVGRMNIDMVWAEIAVAALAGSVFYGVVALIERATTFWHPSVRGG